MIHGMASERQAWRRRARYAALAGLAACASCDKAPQVRAQPVRLVLASRPASAGLTSLVDHFNAKLPHLTVSQYGTGGSVVVVTAVNAGEGDIGLAQADVVYAAYRRGTEDAPFPHANLSAIAVLTVNKFYVFVHRGSRLRRIDDLRGKRIVIAQRTGSASELLTRMVLGAHHMSYSDVKVEFAPFDEMGQRFADGASDAMIIVGSGTARSYSAPTDPQTLELLPIGNSIIRALRTEYPFLKPVVLPSEELPGQHEPIKTLGVDSLLICRKNLDAELVYQLTKQFFAWPEFEPRYPAASDLTAATPIPLHPGAARYYREQEILR
jgi:uncharacterized protein